MGQACLRDPARDITRAGISCPGDAESNSSSGIIGVENIPGLSGQFPGSDRLIRYDEEAGFRIDPNRVFISQQVDQMMCSLGG